jgi:hypothetical protein
MLDDMSTADSYALWNVHNPALDGVQAYTLHVHRNKNITQNTTGVGEIHFPKYLMTQKEKKREKKSRLFLHRKIAGMVPIDDFPYYVENVRRRMEKYPELPERSEESSKDSKEEVLDFILKNNITELEIHEMRDRSKYTMYSDPNKTPTINVGIGPQSLTSRLKEIYNPTVRKPRREDNKRITVKKRKATTQSEGSRNKKLKQDIINFA